MTCLFCFLLGFGGSARLAFVFPWNIIASVSILFRFSLAVLLTVLDSERWLLLLSCYIVRLAGNNSLINLLILEILASLGLFFHHKFYCRLPGLADVYNYGKAVSSWGKLFCILWVNVWTSQRVMGLSE